MSVISLFKKTFDTIPEKDIEIDMFLSFIREGEWQDLVLPIRTIEDKELRNKEKKKVPSVTISGKFLERADSKIVSHSGFIAIDFDGLYDIEKFKDTISRDRFCYSVFKSISGRGLCMLVKIDGDRHRDAFEGLQQYIYNTYGEIVAFDKTVKNESRLRFVSFDPDLYFNPKSAKFTRYVKKVEKKYDNIVYVKDDFDNAIKELESRGLNITETYDEWLRCGFSLAEKMGESGRAYYHTISSFSAKYTPEKCDKQYNYCLNANGNGTTIATLYYYLKKSGIPVYSEKTKTIASITSSSQKTHVSKEDTIKNLIKHEGLEREEVEDIVNQIYDGKLDLKFDESIIIDIKNWIRHNYNLKLNSITQYIENNGIQLDDTAYNSIFVKCKEVFGEKLSTALIKEILHSDFVQSHNPIDDFFKENKDYIPNFLPGDLPDIVKKLWSTFTVNDHDYLVKYGTKWLVSIISAAHYVRSPLMLILVGDKNVGKSEFFERLLPKQLQKYFGNPDLASAKDLHIVMGQKLLILDDEVTGKSKKEDSTMKKLLTAPFFTLRKPFGSTNVDIKRLAVFCGTSNVVNILTDPTGNRRFLPVQILSRDFEAFDKIDKTELFMALYQMWKDGFDWRLSSSDIAELKNKTEDFVTPNTEYELFNKYFKLGGDEFYTTTDIKMYIQNVSGETRISLKTLGAEIQGMGCIPISGRQYGKDYAVKGYYLTKRLQSEDEKKHF
jgi:predicted P-loop ATPase